MLAQVEVRSREQRPGSYLGHTPRLRPLNHEADLSAFRRDLAPGDYPGSRSPSQVSAGLRLTGHVARRCYPPGLSPCEPISPGSPFMPPRGVGNFRGQNVEAPPYPSVRWRSRFGTVSSRTHLQALSGLSWLSYSRPGDLLPVPDSGQESASPVTRSKAPHASRVERAAPNKSEVGPDPYGRDSHPLCTSTTPPFETARACPCRPRSGGIRNAATWTFPCSRI